MVEEKSWSGVHSVWRCPRTLQSGRQHQQLEISTAAYYITNHKRRKILQQGGAPSHTSASTVKLLKAKKIKVLLDWSAQTPDRNITMKEEVLKMTPTNLEL